MSDGTIFIWTIIAAFLLATIVEHLWRRNKP